MIARCRVVASEAKTPSVHHIKVEKPAGFAFAPVQFCGLEIETEQGPEEYSMSLACSPTRPHLEFGARISASPWKQAFGALRPGDEVEIDGPYGHFILQEDRPAVFFAGGIGITPLLSMLRYAVSSHPMRPVTLIYSARNRDALAFLPELRVLAQRHPQVRIGITLSESGAPAPWRTGRIDLPFIKQYVAHPAHTIFCVCGPAAMMTDMERVLVAAGVPPTQIRSEKFETAVAATVLNAPSAPADAAHRGNSFQVTFSATGRTSRTSGSHTLLETAEADGIAITSSCRSGVCQTCRTRLADGDVDCQSTVLDDDDRAAGFILPCVSWAQSDCVLEA